MKGWSQTPPNPSETKVELNLLNLELNISAHCHCLYLWEDEPRFECTNLICRDHSCLKSEITHKITD